MQRNITSVCSFWFHLNSHIYISIAVSQLTMLDTAYCTVNTNSNCCLFFDINAIESAFVWENAKKTESFVLANGSRAFMQSACVVRYVSSTEIKTQLVSAMNSWAPFTFGLLCIQNDTLNCSFAFHSPLWAHWMKWTSSDVCVRMWFSKLNAINFSISMNFYE